MFASLIARQIGDPRRGFNDARTFCGLDFICLAHRSANRGPPARVPYGKTIHRIVLPTLLRFASQGFRFCGSGEGFHPHERGVLSAEQPRQSLPPRAATQQQNQLSLDSHKPFEKGLSENF